MAVKKYINTEIMKKQTKILLVAIAFFALPMTLLSQNPPHPNGGSGPGGGNTPVGGGAPLGSGLIVMLALGSAYGLKKQKTLNLQK